MHCAMDDKDDEHAQTHPFMKSNSRQARIASQQKARKGKSVNRERVFLHLLLLFAQPPS